MNKKYLIFTLLFSLIGCSLGTPSDSTNDPKYYQNEPGFPRKDAVTGVPATPRFFVHGKDVGTTVHQLDIIGTANLAYSFIVTSPGAKMVVTELYRTDFFPAGAYSPYPADEFKEYSSSFTNAGNKASITTLHFHFATVKAVVYAQDVKTGLKSPTTNLLIDGYK